MGEQRKYKLTPREFQELKAKLSYLESEGRERVVEAISEARAHGDLSENAEYHAAREEQGKQEAEIRRVRYMLDNAEIVEAGGEDVVGPGKLVTIRHPGEDPETYLLGIRDTKDDTAVLTPDSPIGRAIIGRSPGETVVAEAPAGELPIEIVDVKNA